MMSTMTITAWQQAFFVFVTVADLAAALVVAWGLVFARMNSLPPSHKLGLIVVAFGLMWQAWRNIVFLSTGHSPRDIDSPFWALKDIGFFIICVSAVAAIAKAKAERAGRPAREQGAPAHLERRSSGVRSGVQA